MSVASALEQAQGRDPAHDEEGRKSRNGGSGRIVIEIDSQAHKEE